MSFATHFAVSKSEWDFPGANDNVKRVCWQDGNAESKALTKVDRCDLFAYPYVGLSRYALFVRPDGSTDRTSPS